MIRITKLGRIPRPTEYRGECKNCGTEAFWLETDAHTVIARANDITFTRIKCPLCFENIPSYA